MHTTESALIHDIGHEVATLSALVTAIRLEGGFDAAAGQRIALVEQEIERLRDLVAACCAPDRTVELDGPVDLRELLREVVTGRDAASPGSVVLRPGPRVLAVLDVRAAQRLVANLVDNAVRAAGPAGRVEVELGAAPDPVVRVVDDGPGPDRGPGGDRGMGLAIVRTLACRLGAEVTLRPRRGGGAVAEVELRSGVPDPGPAIPTSREASA